LPWVSCSAAFSMRATTSGRLMVTTLAMAIIMSLMTSVYQARAPQRQPLTRRATGRNRGGS
jgi:hypothetical protein